ncbi:MAG: cold-shock protein [Ekhidna sp.]|nr:cold-shock protein [Ekhidna sp.]
MSRSQNSFIKNQKEKKRLQKRKEKEEKKKERQENNNKGGNLDDMIAYVDEFGNIVDTKPEEPTPEKNKKTDS